MHGRPRMNDFLVHRLIRVLARHVRLFAALAGVLLLAGCASTLAPSNRKLDHFDPDYGYRFTNIPPTPATGGLLVSMSFSGGGTRAAALSYGVLEELARTPVQLRGQRHRLLDQVRSISAVSGGSYTAAYYGLFGDRIFEDFEQRFLKRDVQSEIVDVLSSPVNLFRMTSPFFGRTDVTAEYLDDTLFERKTFGDMLAALRAGGRPYIQINATDMARLSRFEFSQEQFDLLCSDLSQFPVARAVAASSAVPVVFSPINLKNHAGQCAYAEPEWMATALQSRAASIRRYTLAGDLRSYLDADKRRFVHLLDGGLSDNLGLRGMLDRLTLTDAKQLADMYHIDNTRRIVQIVVNAQTRAEFPMLDRHAEVPTLGAIAFAISNTTDRYSVETLALSRGALREVVEAVKALRRQRSLPDADDVRGYLIEITFDALQDEEERNYFNQLPTSFRLPAEAVDRLREVGGRLLRDSPEFRQLLRELH